MNASLQLPSTFADQIKHYADLLLTWNKTHKVTGIKSHQECQAHVEDSIFPLTFLPPFSRVLDIGSGAGLPAIPLAIAKPDAHFTLVEPLQKRYSFLTLCCVQLGLHNVTIEPHRVEQITPFAVDLVTSRAVAPTPILLDLAQPFITNATTLLFYKGEKEFQAIQSQRPHRFITTEKRHYLLFEGTQHAL